MSDMPELRPSISPEDIRHEVQKRRIECDRLLQRQLIRPGGLHSALDGETAYKYLLDAHTIVSRHLIAEAGCFSRTQWLWYLRRVPNLVFSDPPGNEKSSTGFVRGIAEVLSSLGGLPESDPRQITSAYLWDRTVVGRLLHFSAGVHYLTAIDWLLRCAGRGVELRLSPNSELPNALGTPQASAADKFYIDRLASQGRLFRRSGVDNLEWVSNSREKLCVLVVGRNDETTPTYVKELLSPECLESLHEDIEGGQVPDRILVNYINGLVDPEKQSKFIQSLQGSMPGWPNPEFYLVLMAARFALQAHRKLSAALLSTLEVGYWSVYTDTLERGVSAELPEIINEMRSLFPSVDFDDVASEFLTKLQNTQVSLRPLKRGPLVRVDGDLALVDMEAISSTLDKSADFPDIQGDVANIRGGYFEDSIQRTIDQSPWAPPVEFRNYHRRVLRQSGRALTDVDGVGVKDSYLLLVSAKSIRYSDELSLGDFRAVRNASSTVLNACLAAGDVAAFLRGNPRGDNYDFSSFRELNVVVCVPHVIWVPVGPAMADVRDGLRAALTLQELAEWLNADRPN